MGTIKNIIDYSDEILGEAQRLQNEGISYKDSYRQALKSYADYCTNQSNSNLDKNFNLILAENEDIDNGEIFQIDSGITKKDL